MQIRIRETGQVMYEGELRAHLLANGGPSFNELTSEVLEAIGADVVLEGPQAIPTRYQTAFRDGVEQIDGQWFTKYSVADMDQEAITALDVQQAIAARKERDEKLAKTDWRYRRDQTTTQAWDDYCQALRDLPSQAGFPWDIVWPEQP